MMTADDLRAEHLAPYLLGEERPWLRSTRGLIGRVASRVREYDDPQGPGFVTGSVQMLGSRSSPSSESTEILFDLAVSLIQWMAGSKGTDEASHRLWLTLRRDGISDVDYLLGWEGSAGEVRGKLSEVQEKVRDLTRDERIPEQNQARCNDLIEILRGFMGECAHSFEEQPSEVEGTHVLRCALCGAAFVTYGDNPEMFTI